MNQPQLIKELTIIRIELQELGRLILIKNEDALNHRRALSQHVSRIIKELEDDNV